MHGVLDSHHKKKNQQRRLLARRGGGDADSDLSSDDGGDTDDDVDEEEATDSGAITAAKAGIRTILGCLHPLALDRSKPRESNQLVRDFYDLLLAAWRREAELAAAFESAGGRTGSNIGGGGGGGGGGVGGGGAGAGEGGVVEKRHGAESRLRTVSRALDSAVAAMHHKYSDGDSFRLPRVRLLRRLSKAAWTWAETLKLALMPSRRSMIAAALIVFGSGRDA